MTDIPVSASLNNLDMNVDPNYRPNNTLDYEFLRIPKEENLLQIETRDFDEFQRTFKCKRAELIHLIKGLGAERNFNIMVSGDNVSKSYRLINFKCTDSKYKKRERDMYMDKCTFYLQYMEEPD